METSELRSSLEVVFEKEKQDLYNGHHTFTVYDTKDGYTIRYPHAETLIQLYLTVRNNQRLRSYLVDALKTGIRNSDSSFFVTHGTYLEISSLCFYTLVNIGYVNEAIASLKKRKKYCEGLFNLISQMLPMNYFDITQLKDISSKTIREMESTSEWVSSEEGRKLNANIVSLRYEILAKQVSKINVEINEDKKTVSEKIGYLGFNQNYNELLDGIDDFLNADTEKFINAGMISNLRTFTADLLKDIAYKIAEKEQEKITMNDTRSEIGNIRRYLKRKLDLSDKDDKFVDSFVDILHAEGGHAFMSEKEYFRLARNIAIEITLFILSKYEKKFV